jgi:hypothetical protein
MQPMIAIGGILAFTSFEAGCVMASHDCTTEARPSLIVTVMGPEGRICDADVVAEQDGDRSTLVGSECTYAGPPERPGTFVVTASKSGFRPSTATVTVGSDECHVIGEKITLTLSPE